MLRPQVVCSPGGLCPAFIACFCTHGSGRVEQGASQAVLGNAVSIRDSLLLTERGCVPSVGKTSALRSPPEPVFVVRWAPRSCGTTA